MQHLGGIVRGATALLLDVAWIGALLSALAILVTGGSVFMAFGHRVSALRAENPLIVVFVLLPVRWLVGKGIPVLSIPRGAGQSLPQTAARFSGSFFRWLSGLDDSEARKAVVLGLLVSFAVKAANAWYYHGFTHGDAVEVHQMTFSALFRSDLGVWNLRSPFYPMFFIYPAQWLCRLLGGTDPAQLVFAGRIVVIAFSLLNLWLVFRIARAQSGRPGPALLAFGFLWVSHLHVRLGSTELPRTVSSSFILACYLLLLRRGGSLRALAAGLSLGLGASLRFGEAVFFAPCGLQLLIERRARDLAWVVLGAVCSCLLVLGPGDLLHWPQMFFSLRNIIDFSFAQGLSSSGYEPWWHYLIAAPRSTDPFMIGLFLYSLRLRLGIVQLWHLVPLCLLCTFQHKDARYLLPLLPFFVLCASRAYWRLLEICRDRSPGHLHLLAIYLLAGIMLFEVDGFRRRGSEAVVDVARFLAGQPGLQDVAIEGAGADLYLVGRARVLTIDPGQLTAGSYLWGFLRRPEAQYVVVKQDRIAALGLEDLFTKAGFREATPVQLQDGPFRIFKRKGRTARGRGQNVGPKSIDTAAGRVLE